MNNRMIKVFSIVAIIFLLTVSLASVALANQAEEAQQGKSKAQQEIAQNMARAAEKNWFGQFTMEDGTVDGRFVKFDYNETTGTISDYKVFIGETYVNVFDEVKINNFDSIETSIQGAVFMMNGTHAKLMIHNNPRALMQIVNPYDDTPLLINYTVDENVDINEEIQPTAVKYSLSSDDLNGVINTPLNTTVEDDIITVNGEGWNETSHTMFMSKPSYTKEPKRHQDEFEETVMNSKIGTEMEVVGKGEGHVSHEVRYRQNLQVQVQNMEEKKMRVRVQSEDPNGTCVMLRVEKQSLDIEENKLQMRLDGEKMKETSFQKVLEGGEQAKYSIQEQEDGMLEIAVNVPHFSEREITVESASETPGYTLPILLTAVGVVGVIWAVRKKRN